MAKFENKRLFPAAVSGFVKEWLNEAILRRKSPKLLNLFWREDHFKPRVFEADVRWFSSYCQNCLTCSGELLGRWWVTPDRVEPHGYDFLPFDPADCHDGLASLVHPVIVDFAFGLNSNRCLIVTIDLEGKLERAEFQSPSGPESFALGEQIGATVRERLRRVKGDQCTPKGWTGGLCSLNTGD